MGAFFTNVQVRSRDLDAIARAIRTEARQRGMDELDASSAASPDRSVLVLPPDGGGWIAIYDESTEGQDGNVLGALAVATSRAAGDYAITVTIHDSDVLFLELYRDGARIDRVDSNPGYFGGRGTKPTGDPAAWKELGDPDALREAWRAEDLFAERTLRRTAELIGCDVRRASTGYRYTVKDGDELPAGTIALRFRSRARPSWEQASRDPPALVAESYVEGDVPLAVGDELRVSLGARSAGRASRGLGARCWGSAIEQGLVVVERFEVLVGDPLRGAKHVVVTPELSRAHDGSELLVADLREQAIPAGSAQPFEGFRPGMDVMKALQAAQRSKVHVNVVGRVVAPGKGELGIGLVPLESASAAAGTIARLAIDAPLPRPLRMRETSHGATSHLLRPLQGRTHHGVLVAIDAPRGDVAAIAGGLLDDAREALGARGEVHTAIHFAEAQRRPKTHSGTVASTLRGPRWYELVRQMTSEQIVSLTVVATERPMDEVARRGGAGDLGIAVGTSILRDREEERVPTIAAWVDAAIAPAVRERWSARIDDAMRARGVQASMSWSGAPIGIEHTPYENACGIAHGVGTLRTWITRWVRVPGNDRLWLSRALAARVDRGALADVADVHELGDTIRIELRDPADLPRLERAIEDLLPTPEESQRAAAAHRRAR
ncbi:hypothetical protein [Sandaracinus amylolyticus]|uniref:Uncharacterized protein n=1 Tax=Sandaracinus amylolyticus TaxID=927083 RepID=A0A0F6W6Y6_9BACT|nr:hypothetical protein [Sandaracinus amylolyticus]AKF08998.1 hypothetical protein DB32_006147 [Sandaracinus amylolyticus]